jgi:signal transduction histidine kinase
MNDLKNYTDLFFSFQNPFFFAFILVVALVAVLIVVYIKFIYPLQKKLFKESQRYLIEKAELMALFAEMDPDPLIRIDGQGNILQTNEESRKIFSDIEKSGKKISEFLPSLRDYNESGESDFIETINGIIYSVWVKKKPGHSFINIYMHNITKLKEYESKLEFNQRRLKLLSERLDSEIENLKDSLSSELHDDIGQRLIMAKLKIAGLETSPAKEIYEELEIIYNRIRELSRSLKPHDLNNLGLKLTLQLLIADVTKRSNIKGSFEFYGSEDGVDKSIVMCSFRIVQEAINNIIKHSEAEEFSIQVSIKEKNITLAIIDDGCGIPPRYFNIGGSDIYGSGLFSMKERIEKLNGKLRIESNPETGTYLFIEIPRG